MLHRLKPDYERPFALVDYFVINEHRHGRGLLSEAMVKVRVGEVVKFTAAEGKGPIDALSTALRLSLVDSFPFSRRCA